MTEIGAIYNDDGKRVARWAPDARKPGWYRCAEAPGRVIWTRCRDCSPNPPCPPADTKES